METVATGVKEPLASETTPGVDPQLPVTHDSADETPVERRMEVRLTMNIPVTLSLHVQPQACPEWTGSRRFQRV